MPVKVAACKNRPSNVVVNLRIHHGGKFEFSNHTTNYSKGKMQLYCGTLQSSFNVDTLRKICAEVLRDVGNYKGEFEIWYILRGKTLTTGRCLLTSNDDIAKLLETKDHVNYVTIYVIEIESPTVIGPSSTSTTTRMRVMRPNVSLKPSRVSQPLPFQSSPRPLPVDPYEKKPNLKAHKNPNCQCGPSCEGNLFHISRTLPTYTNSTFIGLTQKVSQQSVPKKNQKGEKQNRTQITNPLPLRRSPRRHTKHHPASQTVSHIPPLRPEIPPSTSQNFPSIQAPIPTHFNGAGVKLTPRRRLHLVDTGNGKVSSVGVIDVGEAVQEQGVVQTKGGTKQLRRKGKEVEVVLTESDSEEEYLTDTEGLFDGFEEHCADDDDLYVGDVAAGDIIDVVEQNLGIRSTIWGVDDFDVRVEDDQDEDSEELLSLHGSDEEVDSYPIFNPNVDFKKPIVLKLGLTFPSAQIFRKALQYHSVENGYDFYYSHNGRKRVTAYCKKRCSDCVWDNKRSKLGACNCKGGRKCDFKVHAKKLKFENTIQIKSINLKHKCVFSIDNRKVTAAFLAEKYLNFLRCNMDWKVKRFKETVESELNVHVTYDKCWEAKQRAKLIINGNDSEQYAKVWDYVAAIKKHNPGSTAIVVCDGIEKPPVYFKRMYICLQACKEGFTKGCRPILGVDGCHLKGSYSGMCLVAVTKDGNNDIFPVAWAVVEKENSETWAWFLELLASDIGKEDGKGVTFMSDRQKGLLDAFGKVVPTAETRFCTRHIWANFKLNFSGQAYKESFWKAAKSTTKADFDREMEGIKFLSEEAWNYLNAIPARHWSRHAFDTYCKSNMLLNNLCETFNSVLKEARDKPIFTHMEWMRRYVMQRMCEKREGADKEEGKFMPYANKYLKWAIDESRLCKTRRSVIDVYEVDYKNNSWVVDLKAKTCSCFNWDLTGLPCVHGVACILRQRLDPEDFVDDAYTKAKYLATYTPSVGPMPGPSQWEHIRLPEPLPPVHKKMPGRPSSKKRKKEPGESETTRVKRIKKANKCGNCGELGHYKRTCKKAAAPPSQPTRGGKPPSNTEWAKQARAKAEKRKALKAAYDAQIGSHSASQTTTIVFDFPTQASSTLDSN